MIVGQDEEADRGGHGGGRTSYKTTNTNKRKTIEDYNFYVGSHKQASDFETTYEFFPKSY